VGVVRSEYPGRQPVWSTELVEALAEQENSEAAFGASWQDDGEDANDEFVREGVERRCDCIKEGE
jgi:hypothetical protein